MAQMRTVQKKPVGNMNSAGGSISNVFADGPTKTKPAAGRMAHRKGRAPTKMKHPAGRTAGGMSHD